MSDWGEIYTTKVAHSKINGRMFRRLIIKRHDGGEVLATWSELQAIKNEIVGEGVRMIEVYPETGRVINDRNYRHLWEIPDDLVLTLFDVQQGRGNG